MFDINSQEKQAHHQFMTLSSDQQKEVKNHELFGNAAAYHAATAFTDHAEKNGTPENQSDAQNMILGYAKDFVDTQIDTKGLKLEKEQAMKYTATILQDRFNSNYDTWQMKYTTPNKAFDDWSSTEKQNGDSYNNNGNGNINVYNRPY